MAETSAMVPFFFNFALRCYCLQLLNCLLYHIATNSFGLQIFMTIFTACIYCTVLPTSSWRIPWLHWSVSASNSSFGVTIWPAWSHEVYLFRTLPFAASRVILFTFSCVFFNSTSHNFSIIWSRRFSLKALPAYCLHKRTMNLSAFSLCFDASWRETWRTYIWHIVRCTKMTIQVSKRHCIYIILLFVPASGRSW